EAVIKRPRRLILLLRCPIGAACAAPVGLSVGRFDECPADAPAASRRRDEKVFEIAIPSRRPGRTVKHERRNTQRSSRLIGRHQRHHIVSAREEPLPCERDDVVGHGRFVKRDVVAKKREPRTLVGCLYRPYADFHQEHSRVRGALRLPTSTIVLRVRGKKRTRRRPSPSSRTPSRIPPDRISSG